MPQRLATILETKFGVQEIDLREAEKQPANGGAGLGAALLKRKAITEEQLLAALSLQFDMPVLSDLPVDDVVHDFTHKIPIQYLKKHLMIPMAVTPSSQALKKIGNSKSGEQDTLAAGAEICLVALNDPVQFQALDDLARMLDVHDFQTVLSTRTAILSAINVLYDQERDSAEQLVQDIEDDGKAIISEIEDIKDLLDDTSAAPVIRLVNHIISKSVKARASDIHFEPYRNSFSIRYRIDGILYDLISPPKWIQPSLTSRIKVMADMNIAEKRLPQDGRFDVRIGDQDIDVRVSTIPTSFGERCVLRLLNKTTALLHLTELGLTPQKLELLNRLIRTPNGIVLVTGPTGSGKTTSLYAVLSTINTADINIITIEDPVEYQIRGVSQIQVNAKIDLTFASGLRSIVRQDPDVILVGEIRDQETADIAVHSALTGHLVFSTLHTNDAAGAITRLVDIGIEPFLLSSSVIAVVAQRLVRTLCSDCKQPAVTDGPTLSRLGVEPEELQGTTIYSAKGCPACLHTGYRGRIGIFEIMVLGDHLKRLILKTCDAGQIKREALARDMETLHQDGIQKVKEGITTIEEVLRVTQK